MRFASAALSVVALAATAVSALPNPFTLAAGFTASAGRPAQLTWTPTTGGTVTILLRQGTQGDLNTIQKIASHTANDGELSWIPSSSLVYGTDYVLEIISDQDPSETNYSAYITVHSPNTVSSISSSKTPGYSTKNTYSTSSLPTSTKASITSKASSILSSLTSKYTTPPHYNTTLTNPYHNTTMTKSKTTAKPTTHKPTTILTSHSSQAPSPSKTGGGNAPTNAAASSQMNAVGMLVLAVAGAVAAL